MMSSLRVIAREIRYFIWKVNGFIGWRAGSGIPQKTTILITYYSPERMKHLDSQIRNILKCSFVDRVIVSNHNPDIRIEQVTTLRDKRVLFINQEKRHGCGYRWEVAAEFDPEYLIVIDDDILLFPFQLAKLFKHLVEEPEIPHGLTGMLHLDKDRIEYYERENMDVDYLCEIYAISRQNLRHYRKLERDITKDANLSRLVESSMDFMLISQTGSYNPKIHNVGRIFRCPTFNQANIAVHKADGFEENMAEVYRALTSTVLGVNEPALDVIPIENHS